MNLEKFSKKSGKAIAKSYLNVVKFSKAFRIFVLAFLMLMCWWIFTTSIKATTVLAVCVILIVCNHLVVQNQVRQYNSMTYILTELLDAEKYLELCQVLNEKIKRTSGMSALNLANAYYWTGHFDKAKETLEKAVINGNKQATTVMDVQYDMVNFNILAELGDITSCEMLIARMEKRIYDNQNKPKFTEVLEQFLLNMKAGLAFAKGDFEEYISLDAQHPEAPSKLKHISRQYRLALCYEALGSRNMAETYLENTLSANGSLYIQKLAKDKLNKLKGEK
ncbi:MAG: hypothetical protein IJN84_06490 [Clostridia bacterium]|nr:hypothetical protein [Clostridia bacterium]